MWRNMDRRLIWATLSLIQFASFRESRNFRKFVFFSIRYKLQFLQILCTACCLAQFHSTTGFWLSYFWWIAQCCMAWKYVPLHCWTAYCLVHQFSCSLFRRQTFWRVSSRTLLTIILNNWFRTGISHQLILIIWDSSGSAKVGTIIMWDWNT